MLEVRMSSCLAMSDAMWKVSSHREGGLVKRFYSRKTSIPLSPYMHELLSYKHGHAREECLLLFSFTGLVISECTHHNYYPVFLPQCLFLHFQNYYPECLTSPFCIAGLSISANFDSYVNRL